MSRLYLSAAHKSSGKTIISLGLCAALAQRGLRVQPFKKGPDYIDPLWLSQAAGQPCHNLDFYTQSADELRHVARSHSATADIALIEGNKGLYDGLALDGSNSNAALANLLHAPVVLVIDTRGITRGIAPLLQGYLQFAGAPHIVGVILNQVSGARHEQKLRDNVAHYTGLPVLGAVQHSAELAITERHLGLVPSNEQAGAATLIARIASHIAAQVNLDALLALAAQASPWPAPQAVPAIAPLRAADVRVGIIRDAAFGFYYPGDLDALRAAGAELVWINALTDPHLPPLDGLFIGGGFPETHAQALADNASFRAAIRQVVADGLPVYAECGGLMYLARRLHWGAQSWDMAGALALDTRMHDTPQGRGYIRLRGHGPWPGGPEEFPAHEFHHSSVENLPANARFAYRVLRGQGMGHGMDGFLTANTLAGYAHLRHVWQNPWAECFVAFIRQIKAQRAP